MHAITKKILAKELARIAKMERFVSARDAKIYAAEAEKRYSYQVSNLGKSYGKLYVASMPHSHAGFSISWYTRLFALSVYGFADMVDISSVGEKCFRMLDTETGRQDMVFPYGKLVLPYEAEHRIMYDEELYGRRQARAFDRSKTRDFNGVIEYIQLGLAVKDVPWLDSYDPKPPTSNRRP